MTNQEQINEWEVRIEKICYNYKYLNKRCGAACDAGTLNPEGHLYHAIWMAFDTMVDMIDRGGWISWYVFENECGAKRMEAGHNGKLSKITTPRQLAKLIVKDENCNLNQNKP